MVRTRFAPSPTGYLHIGGVRTALFNWLFARKHGGQFILRIDDTDQQRNVEEALAPILHGFRWLGIDWDEGPNDDGKGSHGPHAPYFQSQRSERYQAAVEQLLASGAAYRDYARTEEIQAEREAAQLEKRSFVYSRRWMAKSPVEAAAFEAEGRQAVVRLKMPREGKLVLDDLVRGRVEFDWAAEQDHVIQRADGSCLYHLATVVDDHDFEITHVIRAEEHLSNTPRQVFIFDALGYDRPQFAHLPYVAEPGSKRKISKRKLNQYLKVKEFRTLYEHGLNVAFVLNRDLVKFAAERGIPFEGIISEDRQKIIDRVHTGMEESIQRSAHQPLPREWVDEIIEHTKDLFASPQLLDEYGRGLQIAAAKGVDTSPELFNPVLVGFYKNVGYLPDALINYLLLLGWALDDRTEFFSRDEMIAQFSLERVNKAPASFDPAKLLAFQDHYMQQLDLKKKVAKVLPFLQQAGLVADPPPCDTGPKLAQIVAAAGDRIKMAGDILDYTEFYTDDDKLPCDEKAFEKRIRKPGAADLLRRFRGQLADVEPFDAETVEAALRSFIDSEGIKIADIIHALRVAVTGKSVGLGMFDAIAILGKASCLSRIDRALAKF